MTRSRGNRVPALRKRDGDNCKLCGDLINFAPDIKTPKVLLPSVDHKIPLAAGGSGRMENLQLAHVGCNNRKGGKLDGKDYGLMPSPYGIGKHYRHRWQKRYGEGPPNDGADWETPVLPCGP